MFVSEFKDMIGSPNPRYLNRNERWFLAYDIQSRHFPRMRPKSHSELPTALWDCQAHEKVEELRGRKWRKLKMSNARLIGVVADVWNISTYVSVCIFAVHDIARIEGSIECSYYNVPILHGRLRCSHMRGNAFTHAFRQKNQFRVLRHPLNGFLSLEIISGYKISTLEINWFASVAQIDNISLSFSSTLN